MYVLSIELHIEVDLQQDWAPLIKKYINELIIIKVKVQGSRFLYLSHNKLYRV